MTSQETFATFLAEFGISRDVVEKLRNGNVRSVEELASSGRSTIRGLVDHPVLNTILPVLQQHSTEISMAEDPYSHALDLLQRHAEDEEEEVSSVNIPTGSNEMPSVTDIPSTSTLRQTESTEQTNQTLNANQRLSAEDEGTILEQATNLQDKDGILECGDKKSLNVSGGNVVQPNIGGITTYNKDNIVIEKALFQVSLMPEDQPTTSFNEERKLGSPQCKEDETNNAMAKLREAIRERNRAVPDIDLSNIDNPGITSDQLPEVYPKIYSVKFYDGNFIPNDEQYNPKLKTIKLAKSDQKKTMEEMISNVKMQSFISLVGYPGAGKTTLSKRLTRHFANSDDYVVLRFSFMNMSNSENDKLTLKQFLLGDVNLKLNDNEKNCAFDWIKNHPEKCYFIFDGLDQVDWTIKKNLKVNPQFDTCFTPQDIISMLCQGTFLQNCHLLITSRPHAMMNIPQICRPKQTYFLRDLAFKDVKRLFYALVNNHQTADQLWYTLQTDAPQLASMCHNPLFLQLYVKATLSATTKKTNIATTTAVFQLVLQNLKASGHAVSLDNPTVMKLASIAFKATKRGTVLITLKDLKEEDANLTSVQVQDIVIALLGTDKTCALLEGNQQLYFTHQTLQEYFAAFYIRRELPVKEFESFLRKNMVSAHWSMVMNFLSGILMDQYTQKGGQSDVTIGILSKLWPRNKDKKDLFLEVLKEETTNVAKEAEKIYLEWLTWSTKFWKMSEEDRQSEKVQKKGKQIREKLTTNAQHTLSICNMLSEANSEEVVKTVAACFVESGISLWGTKLSQSDVQKLAGLIKAIPRVKLLYVADCNLNSDRFSILRAAIEQMTGSIDVLDIDTNRLATVDDIIPVMHKIKKELWTGLCFDGGDGYHRFAEREEQTLLQETLDSLENTNLKICVEYGFDKDPYVFLKHKNHV